MKIEEIRINPQNHHEYCEEMDSWDGRFNAFLDIHTDIHRFLDDALCGGRTDWAGVYYSWLEVFGFEAQTNGWWSKAAVDPVNLQAFLDDYTELDDGIMVDRLDQIREYISPLKKAGISIAHRYANITELLEAFEKSNDK